MLTGTPDTEPLALSIIVVSYNTREMTLACLRSIAAETFDMPYEVIVVDNASDDGSAEAIAELGVPLRLIPLAANVGFARANNLASQAARGDYLLLLNPDTVVLDRAVDRLFQAARRNPGASIWGGRTDFADGTLNPTSCWRHMSLWTQFCQTTRLTRLAPNNPVFNAEAYGGWQRDTARHVDIVSGCFLMIRRTLWEDLGGFDPSYFMYAEEADLCLRARCLGARPLFVPDARIIHHGGASERTRADKVVRLLTAKATLIRRHWSGWARPLGIGLLACWPLVNAALLQLGGHISRDASLAGRAAEWREVWERRTEWIPGYRPIAVSSRPRPADCEVFEFPRALDTTGAGAV